MAGSPKEKLEQQEHPTEEHDEHDEYDGREVYLQNGRKLVVGEANGNQLVEIRSESGAVEVRIELTEQGPVLRMEAVKLSLRAEQTIELESQKVAIKAGEVTIESEDSVEVDAGGEVRVAGKMIYLN